jgi:aminoglycoside 6'-N-acetyltransferase I
MPSHTRHPLAAGTPAALQAHIRPYEPSDDAEWARMRSVLWPDQTAADMAAWRARSDAATLVAVRADGRLCGFAEVGERAYADGCESTPVAFLEGWYVDADMRRQGLGSALVHAITAWARARGHRELGSDTGLDNRVSQCAHARLGFVEVGRAVLYCKVL